VDFGKIDALEEKVSALIDGVRVIRKNGFTDGVLYITATGTMSYSKNVPQGDYGTPTPSPAPQSTPQA